MGNTGDLEAKGLTIDLAENNNCESDLLGTWSPNDQVSKRLIHSIFCYVIFLTLTAFLCAP